MVVSMRGWSAEQRERYGRYQRRAMALTPRGRAVLAGCDGRWPEPCRDAWPVSRFVWCTACRLAVERSGGRA